MTVREKFLVRGILPELVQNLNADEIDHLNEKTTLLAQIFSGQNTTSRWSNFINKVNIFPGLLTIELDATALAEHLAFSPDRLSPDALAISTPFQLRRRGVETKIILGNTPLEIDQTLIRNIVKAMEWFEAIKIGETFTQIAARAGTSKRRVQDVIDLAFLAPDIIEKAVSGMLPLHFTSDYLIKTGVPADWHIQRKMLMDPTLTNVGV